MVIISLKGMLHFLPFISMLPKQTCIYTITNTNVYVLVCVDVVFQMDALIALAMLYLFTLQTFPSNHVVLFYKAEVLFLCFPVSFGLDLANLASYNISLENYIILSVLLNHSQQ